MEKYKKNVCCHELKPAIDKKNPPFKETLFSLSAIF